MRIWLGADLTHLATDVINHAATHNDQILIVTTPRLVQPVRTRLNYQARAHRHSRAGGVLTFPSRGRVQVLNTLQLERATGAHIDAAWLALEAAELTELNRIVAWCAALERPAPAPADPEARTDA